METPRKYITNRYRLIFGIAILFLVIAIWQGQAFLKQINIWNSAKFKTVTTIRPTQNKAFTTIYFDPGQITVGPGEETTVHLKLNSGKNNISGAEIELIYDSQTLTITDWHKGDYWGKNELILKGPTEKPGRWRIVLGSLIPSSGDKILLSLTLKLKSQTTYPQTTTLTFSPSTLVTDPKSDLSVIARSKSLLMNMNEN